MSTNLSSLKVRAITTFSSTVRAFTVGAALLSASSAQAGDTESRQLVSVVKAIVSIHAVAELAGVCGWADSKVVEGVKLVTLRAAVQAMPTSLQGPFVQAVNYTRDSGELRRQAIYQAQTACDSNEVFQAWNYVLQSAAKLAGE